MPSRSTRQKTAIRKAFQRSGRPLSTNEVLDLAQQESEGVSMATVYRNIKALADEGWLAAVDLPGEPSRYEVSGKDHHHHFRCDSCGRVFELNGCLPALESLAGEDFVVRRHEVVLYGICGECNRAANRKPAHGGAAA